MVIKFASAVDLTKCLEQIKLPISLHTCAAISELPWYKYHEFSFVLFGPKKRSHNYKFIISLLLGLEICKDVLIPLYEANHCDLSFFVFMYFLLAFFFWAKLSFMVHISYVIAKITMRTSRENKIIFIYVYIFSSENLIFILKEYLFSFARAHYVLSYHLVSVPD